MIDTIFEDDSICVGEDDEEPILHLTFLRKGISIYFKQDEWDTFLRSMRHLHLMEWKPSNN